MKICNLSVTLLGLAMIVAASHSGCSNNPAPPKLSQEQVYGPRIGSVLRLAGESGIKERHLMAASYAGGYFGLAEGQKTQEWLSDSGRTAALGLDLRLAPQLGDAGFREQIETLVKKVREKSERSQPNNDFDWLALIADSIVGDFESDPNLRALQLRLVLLDLIEAHNNGFHAVLNDSEYYTLPAADESEKIDLRQLDPGQLRLLNGFRFQGDGFTDLKVEGNNKVRTGRIRGSETLPRLVIRLCPSSTLRCFEALRKSPSLGAHVLSYRAFGGTHESAQFHDPKHELLWHDEAQKDTVTLVVAGMTGATRETMRPDIFDWEDYVALRAFIRRAAGRLTQDVAVDNANTLQREFLKNNVFETLGLIDENAKKSVFPLGATWDSQLFRELLNSDALPKQLSQIRIEAPTSGQNISGNVVEGAVYPDSESGQIQIYQDSDQAKSDGTGWELVLKRDLDPSQRRFDFTHEIRRTGLSGNQFRALKFVNRRNDGTILGSRIVRVRLEGIAKP